MYSIAHVCIYVKDADEACSFYHDILGFEVISRRETDTMKFVYINAAGQVLELLQHIDRVYIPRNSGSIDHIAFYVDDLDKEVERLRTLDIKMLFDKPRSTGETRIMFFEGPEGERIELMEK